MDDKKLVDRVKNGDYQAFGTLVNRYQKQIFRLCYGMTGDILNAEELAHEAFVEGFLKIGQLREAEKFLPWLSTLARNLCRMWHRQNRRDTEEFVRIDAGSDGDESVYLRMHEGLSKLPAPHRLVLVLHYWDGLSYQEIADFLQIPMGTVMSRLHRARSSLKRLMNQITEEEAYCMVSDNQFREEVEAEIRLLLTMFDEDTEAMERLSIILRRSPEHFLRLIQNSKDDEDLENLALLLRRLERPVIEETLDGALSANPTLKSRSISLLQRCFARYTPGPFGMPAHGAYWLLERLRTSQTDAQTKAELLIELLAVKGEPYTMNLLVEFLLCDVDTALPLLLERFWSASCPEDLYQPAWRFFALCRMGARFLEALLQPLCHGDLRQQLLALTGVEKAMSCTSGVEPAPQFSLLRRNIDNYPPVAAAQVPPEVMRTCVEPVAQLISHDNEDIRNAALRVLGQLNATDYQQTIKDALQHPTLSTRLAAIQAVAQFKADSTMERQLINAAENGALPERWAAIGALGRLRVTAAVPALKRFLDDPDNQVRRVAAIALGEIGGESAETALKAQTGANDKAVAKAAAKALYTSEQPRQPSATTRKRLRKIRGVAFTETGASAARPTFYTSPAAAIRALPKLQAYAERDLTRYISQVCSDYSTTRRYLVMQSSRSLMRRSKGVYEFTELGQAVWQIEHFIAENYLKGEVN
jgi:RNA polymerase sigma-70 factor, ECF subfamily